MISLEKKIIETETVIINIRGYQSRITDKSIVRVSINATEESTGSLVSTHFEPVFGCLYLAHLLKDCEVKEAMMQWYIEEQKTYDEVPELGNVLDALLK